MVSNLAPIFPASIMTTTTEFPTQDRMESPSELRARHRILVVDDNPHSAQTLERLLLNERYQVMALSNPVKAAELSPRFAPHLAILDLGMPVMDGLALCKLLRQGPGGGRMHIVAVSGRDYTDAEVKEAGFDRLFLKPLDWPTLKVELARVVAKNEFRRSLLG